MDYEKYFAAYDAAHAVASTQTHFLNTLIESGIGGILFSLLITFMILYSKN